MTAVAENGNALRFAAEELRRDHEVVMTATAQNGNALQYATEELRGDREVVMTAMAKNGYALRFAAEELRRDHEVVMTAMAQNGNALEYATEELRGDREVVMTAVAKNGSALYDAAEELRGDREVVMTAMAENGYALNHATEEFRGDKEIMEAALARARASADGDIPIGLKACLNPIWLPPSLLMSQEEERPQQRLARLCVCSVILSGGRWGGSVLFLLVRPDSETVPCYEKSACGVVEVMLLSGRCFSQIVDLDYLTLEDVLCQFADLLGLDEDQVRGSATLMHGTSVIADLQNDLEAGKLHELTLVMS